MSIGFKILSCCLSAVFFAPWLAGAGEAEHKKEDVQHKKSADPVQVKESLPPGETVRFPWDLDRDYRFSWIKGRTKVGETRFRISAVEAPTGSSVKKAFRCSSSYWYKTEGFSQEGKHETWFDREWKPLRYTCRHQMSGVRDTHAIQEHEGRIANGLLVLVVIHNGDSKNGVEVRMEAPSEGYLLQNQAFDNWAILTGQILRQRPAAMDARIIYPDLSKVYEVRFTFEKEEPIDLGKPEKPICRSYSFRSKEGQFTGKLWTDGKGRMIQYQQGELRIALEE